MGTLTKPYTFSAGGYAVAGQVNADMDALFNWVNAGGAMWSDASVAFSAVPSGPNVDPTSANQFTRKSYVDAIGASVTALQLTRVYGWGVSNMLLQGSVATVVTDANGNYTFPLQNAFPNTLISNIQLLGQDNQGFTDYQVMINGLGCSRTTLAGRIAKTDASGGGAGYNAGTFQINYLAIGT